MARRDRRDGTAEDAADGAPASPSPEATRHPHLEGDLFEAVQTRGLFEDSKQFVDHVLRADPETIQQRYEERRDQPDFDLGAFVDRYFERPPEPGDEVLSGAPAMEDHVSWLWDRLVESQEAANEYDSLIPLPNPHVVPGGRFRESYYWDSYFIAEGLAAQGQLDLVKAMADNLASLIDRFGFVPNGNRRYLLSRSQPPLFCEVVAVLVRERGVEAATEYLPRLEREYEFWMAGRDRLSGHGDAERRVVQLGDNVLNRYWDGTSAPRPESYREDVSLAESTDRDSGKLFRDVRAAAESGWDFSGRWLADPGAFDTIRTTDLVPVDLNAFLFSLECRLATWFDAHDDHERADEYREAARRRRHAIDRYCWDDETGFYFDYDHVGDRRTDAWTLAAVVPLYVGCATDRQAAAVAKTLEEEFLAHGGLLTTLETTGEQWDAPNGWAPLHWMAIRGLERYGHDELAGEIQRRWLSLNRTVYDDEGLLLEKYDVTPGGHAGGGGEYPLQTGFGWTNGVAVALDAGNDGPPAAGDGCFE